MPATVRHAAGLPATKALCAAVGIAAVGGRIKAGSPLWHWARSLASSPS